MSFGILISSIVAFVIYLIIAASALAFSFNHDSLSALFLPIFYTAGVGILVFTSLGLWLNNYRSKSRSSLSFERWTISNILFGVLLYFLSVYALWTCYAGNSNIPSEKRVLQHDITSSAPDEHFVYTFVGLTSYISAALAFQTLLDRNHMAEDPVYKMT